MKLESFDPSDDDEPKATEDPSEVGASTDIHARKRRLAIKERTEAGTENEFRAQSSGIFLFLRGH